MAYITVGAENSSSIELHYEDLGSGRPVVLIHGWPLRGHSREKQTQALLSAGHRVITYDRRGFGASSQPSVGYEYDTFAADLDKLLTHLGLRDVTLVGFSMGTGEVARYLGKFGSDRVSRAAFISGILPFLLRTPENPTGIPIEVFESMKRAIREDRLAFLGRFLMDFYNADTLGGKLVSEELVRWSWNVAANASPKATLDCVQAWLTDFRADLATLDVPSLIIHGDDDRIVPLAATGAELAKLLPESRLVVIPGGPHGLLWSHADKVNAELLSFLESDAPKRRAGALKEEGVSLGFSS